MTSTRLVHLPAGPCSIRTMNLLVILMIGAITLLMHMQLHGGGPLP
jgi:hypothetical protein